MSEEVKEKIVINHDICIGCGTCEGIAPEYFLVTDGLADPLKEIEDTDVDLVNESVTNCPVSAISVE